MTEEKDIAMNEDEKKTSTIVPVSSKSTDTEPQKKHFAGKRALAFGAVIVSFIVGGTIGIAGAVSGQQHSSETKVSQSTKSQSSKSDSSKASSNKESSSSSVTTDDKSSSSSSSDSNAELIAETNQLPRASDYYIGQHVTVRIYGKQEMAVIQAITNDTLVIRYDNANYTVNFDRSVKQ